MDRLVNKIKREDMRERERNIKYVNSNVENSVNKINYGDGMIGRDRDVRTYLKIKDTVHDR